MFNVIVVFVVVVVVVVAIVVTFVTRTPQQINLIPRTDKCDDSRDIYFRNV